MGNTNRPRSAINWESLFDRTRQMLESGASLSATSRKIGVSQSAIRAEFKRRGIDSWRPQKDKTAANMKSAETGARLSHYQRDAFPAGSAVSWSAIWPPGQCPSYPHDLMGR